MVDFVYKFVVKKFLSVNNVARFSVTNSMKVTYEVHVMLNVNEMKMSLVIKCYFVLCEFLKRVKRSIKMQFKG